MGVAESDIGFNCDEFLATLGGILRPENRLLIVIHNNPDPDAIASACALKYLVEEKFRMAASVAFGGAVGRAENRVMLSRLKIRMKALGRIRASSYDRIAFVDTQPGAGNHAFGAGRKCHIVIDHHPRRRDTRADLVLIRPELGATATILVMLLKSGGLDIPSALATGLSYAISSETQALKREAGRLDLEAYLWVYTRSNIRTLGEIIHPLLRHSYFETLLFALRSALVFRNLVWLCLGDVPQPEIVSEMADFFLRHERIGWVFSTGRFRGSLVISLRCSDRKRNAGKVIQRIVGDSAAAGGHDMSAGGSISLQDLSGEAIALLEERLAAAFARNAGYDNFEWKRLMEQPRENGA